MEWFKEMILHRAWRWFLAGVFAILPVVITVAVVIWVGGLIREYLGPRTVMGDAFRKLGVPFADNDTLAYVSGIVLVLLVIFVIGVVVESGARNLLSRLFDALLHRIPLVGTLYGTSKKMVAMLDQKNDANLKGMKVVYCFFGDGHGIGTLALLVSSERFRINGIDYQIVIIPMAPVPVGGTLLFVPADKLQPTEISVEGLMSIYVSMGITAPQFLPTK